MIKYFTKEEEEQIIGAIREAEQHTTGEIRVHLNKEIRASSVVKEAQKVFVQLKMHKTKDRNAVLIFIVPALHQLAIIGDQGINEKVPEDFWVNGVKKMIDFFRNDQYIDGVIWGIHWVGDQLKIYFPSSNNNTNQLTDEISYDED